MSVRLSKSAEKEVLTLNEPILSKIIEKLSILESKPLPRGYKKLKGFSDLYRVRVGDYRIVYSLNVGDIVVLRVRHRKKVYAGL